MWPSSAELWNMKFRAWLCEHRINPTMSACDRRMPGIQLNDQALIRALPFTRTCPSFLAPGR